MNSVMSAYPFSGGPQAGGLVSSQYNPRNPVTAAYMQGPHQMHPAHRQSFAIQELLGLGTGTQPAGAPGLFPHHEPSSAMAYTYPNFVGSPTGAPSAPVPSSSAAVAAAAAASMISGGGSGGGDGELGTGGSMMQYCGASSWRSSSGSGPAGFLPSLGSMQQREDIKYGSSSDPLSSPDGKGAVSGLLGQHGGKSQTLGVDINTMSSGSVICSRMGIKKGGRRYGKV